MVSSGVQTSGSGAWAQVQQLQAQRNADQAAQQASALQSRARAAQSVADRAQENARSLQVQSSQAQGDAQSAKRNLAALDSLGEVQTQLSGLREQISSILSPKVASPAATTVAAEPVVGVINSSGQTTGTLVNVTA
ncbi:MAG: hypothetical protein Q8S26_09850 [Azonexus sp.]|nr:hypothetical protein [Azonexus sp.]